MDSKILLDAFIAVIQEYPGVSVQEAKEVLEEEIEKRRYDLQDEALIEKIASDEERELEKEFRRTLDNYIANNSHEGPSDFLKTVDGLKVAARLFLKDVEDSIDQIYNVLIARHFSEP